jgi:flagellar biosynthesis protein FliO
MKFLLAVILLGLLAGLTPAPTWAQETQVIESQNSDSQQNISTGDEGTAAEFGKGSVDFTWLFLKTLLAMLVVISLAVVSLRFFLPRFTWNRQIKGRTTFKILDRIPLDTKKGLYVVEVEGRRLLLGASEHHVGLITELEVPEEEND